MAGSFFFRTSISTKRWSKVDASFDRSIMGAGSGITPSGGRASVVCRMGTAFRRQCG